MSTTEHSEVEAMVEELRRDAEDLRRELGTLREQLASAREENALLSDSHDQVSARDTHHQEDLRTIADALLREAQERDWCSEYDGFVEKINRITHGSWLQPCVRTVTREWRVMATITAQRAHLDEVIEELRASIQTAREGVESEYEAIDIQVIGS